MKIFPTPEVPADPLKFRDIKRYTDRLKEYRTKTGAADSVTLHFGKLESLPVMVAVQDFDFQGGTLGMAAGEAIITGITAAIERRSPFIIFTASGGARMQEGMFSLMQMPRTTVAVQRLRAAKLPYIVVLTNPTTGGVTASYAMLGDIHIAEPGAVIGFAGARVIEQTIRERLPEGFQRAEYLKAHGMIDLVVPRHEMRATLARLCALLMHAPTPRRTARRGRCRTAKRPEAERTWVQWKISDAIMARFLALHPRKIDLSLGRIETLLAELGHPEQRLPPVIHVAGTNGKGSTIAFMRAILEAAGRRVHVYTSPHLVRFHERIRLAGRLVDEAELAAAFAACEAHECRRADHHFRDHDGGGAPVVQRNAGRLSLARSRASAGVTTRPMSSPVRRRQSSRRFPSIIRNFSDRRSRRIAAEKAGIIKRGVAAILGRRNPPRSP